MEDVIGRLYRTNGQDVSEVVSAFPAERRARIALFCYGRAHMRDIGIAVAATCDEQVLYEAGATAGKVLYALSRERPAAPGKPQGARHKVTLATMSSTAPPGDIDPDPVETGTAEAQADAPPAISPADPVEPPAPVYEQLRMFAEAS